MSWLPDLNITFNLLRQLGHDDDSLRVSSELFWRFCLNSQSPEEYCERIAWWKDLILVRKQGEFTDPDVDALMHQAFENPEAAAEEVVDLLDKVVTENKVEYIPDSLENSNRLFVYTHLEACRTIRWEKLEGNSERTGYSHESAMNAFNRFIQTHARDRLVQYSDVALSSIYLVGSYLYFASFRMKKFEGDYEGAIIAVSNGLDYLQQAFVYRTENITLKAMGLAIPEEEISSEWHNLIPGNSFFGEDQRAMMPWVRDFDAQVIVDCCEAILSARSVRDVQSVIDATDTFYLLDEIWPGEDPYVAVTDASGIGWAISEYIQHFSDWLEFQLQPFEYKKLISEREDESAEKRLKVYFFDESLWDRLPGRAQRALVSADRDFFGGKRARSESILNELKIATEELILYGLWLPLEQWGRVELETNIGLHDFMNISEELTIQRKSPDLLHFERICSLQITSIFLDKLGVNKHQVEWFKKQLPSGGPHL